MKANRILLAVGATGSLVGIYQFKRVLNLEQEDENRLVNNSSKPIYEISGQEFQIFPWHRAYYDFQPSEDWEF